MLFKVTFKPCVVIVNLERIQFPFYWFIVMGFTTLQDWKCQKLNIKFKLKIFNLTLFMQLITNT